MQNLACAETNALYIINILTGTSGEVILHNIPAGEHRVRVIAGNGDAVICSHVILMPENPDFSSLNSINQGVTKYQHLNRTAYIQN